MLKKWFRDSETLLIARLNAFMGFLATITAYVDPALIEPLLTPKAFAIYVLVNGILTEWARRRRDPELGKEADSEFNGENV
ncbi:hypothetical protein [Mesorhizobium sp. Z1-4]|uniref:hypothetical protein n=1 Tax=Mesorhizobium sp. Z1-4 TaxID=2448478 RepID=UPI000FD85DD2|nr:hypothetical protein [Mesorhizobium sp. Z1-4]